MDAESREEASFGGRWPKRVIIPMFFLSLSVPALAHEEDGVRGGFLTGLMHPVLGLDHLLAMVAVGLWGAVLGRPLLYLLPVIFPTIMILGAVVGMGDFPIDFLEIAIAVSVLCLGTLIAGRALLPVWAASLVVGVFAVFHGYAHGRELPLALDPVAYSAGFVLATGALHLMGVGLGWAASRLNNDKLVFGVVGAPIAAAGMFFVYRAAAW